MIGDRKVHQRTCAQAPRAALYTHSPERHSTQKTRLYLILPLRSTKERHEYQAF